MRSARVALLLAVSILATTSAASAGEPDSELRLSPWGNPGVQLVPDHHRGAWGRRWVGQKGSLRMMLTLYRSPQDAARVANLARGLGESAADDDDAAFLLAFIPGDWPVRGIAARATVFSERARGMCLDFEFPHGGASYRLCSASRPDSAAVATVLAPAGADSAGMAALLLARYVAWHPMRIAVPE